MKNTNISWRFGLYIFAAIIGLAITGCASLRLAFSAVRIRSDGNVSSVIPGGSIRLSASGKSVRWSVSSTSDGTGPVAAGTHIPPEGGVLTVAADETAHIIYVFAVSAETGQSDSIQIRVVTVNSVSISPENQAVGLGRSFQFRSSVTGTNNPDNTVTWRVSSNPAGTGAVTSGTNISNNGTLTIAQNETAGTLYVMAASVVNPLVTGTVAVNVVVPVIHSVTVSPDNQTISSGRSLQFSAAIEGTYDPDTTVTWIVSSNTVGTGAVTPGTSISNNGVLTVAADESLPLLYVIAVSAADPSRFGSVSVAVLRSTVTSVSVAPANLSAPAGSAVQFLAAVTGTNNPDTAITWRVSSNAAGTGAVTTGTSINNNGLLTIAANETATTLFVFAVSVFDPTKSGSVIVTVTSPVALPPVTLPAPQDPVVSGVVVNPSSQSVFRGSTLQFTATVAGYTNPNPPMSWRVGSNPDGTGAISSGTGITGNGSLTIGANETATTLYVVATFNPDATRFGSAIITVRSN